ncbi:MAG TPA: MFS transporter [Acidimicrobiales bacterium]
MSLTASALPGRVAARLDGNGRYPQAVLLVAITGLFATTFPVTVLTLAIPTIARDFGTSQASLAWLITLPMLASALALPVLGKLGDLYGHRRVFLVGFALATVATALTATAANPALLIGWRTVSQVAGGSTMPSSLALINSVHHGTARARAMGWWSMTAAGAPVVGLTVGAPVIDAVGWQVLFLLQSGLMVVPVVASWLVLRETPRRDATFDVAGAVALAAGVGPLLLGVNQAPEWGITSPALAACAVLSVTGIATFVAVERRVATPLVPLDFFRHRGVASALSSGFFTGAAYMGGFFVASLLVVEQFGYSLSSAVPILAIRPALFALLSPVGGRLAGRAGSRAGTLAGASALVVGLVGLTIGSAADALAVVVAVGFLGQGVGYGLLRPALTTALADAVDERDLGMAGAAERLTGQVGVAFGITIMATVYGGDVDRFAAAFAVGAVFAVAGTVAALGMRRHRHGGPAAGDGEHARRPVPDGAEPFVPVGEQPR